MPQQRLADSLAAMLGLHEDVFQIDAVAAAKRREVQEPQRETDRSAVPFGKIAKDARLPGEERVRNHRGRRIDIGAQALIVGERANEREHDVFIPGPRRTHRKRHTATCALMCGCASYPSSAKSS